VGTAGLEPAPRIRRDSPLFPYLSCRHSSRSTDHAQDGGAGRRPTLKGEAQGGDPRSREETQGGELLLTDCSLYRQKGRAALPLLEGRTGIEPITSRSASSVLSKAPPAHITRRLQKRRAFAS